MTGRAPLGRGEAAPPDVVVLDLMLDDIDGLDVMRRLRRDDRRRAIILLTARGAASDRIVVSRLGAADYVVEPFSPAELVARVHAVARRMRRPARDLVPPQGFGDAFAALVTGAGSAALGVTRRSRAAGSGPGAGRGAARTRG